MSCIKVKIKNRYAYLRDGVESIGEKISPVLINDFIFLSIEDNELIKIEDDFFNIFEKEKIKNGATYAFEVVESFSFDDAQELWVKLKVELIERENLKLNYAKNKLRFKSIEIKKIIGIYLLEIDNTNYIGQSNDIYRRLGEHLNFLSQGTHVNRNLQVAWDTGFRDISFKVLERLTFTLSPLQRQDWLAEKEKKYIEYFLEKNLANQTPGEFIPTDDAYVEYTNINLRAEEYILKRRKLKSARYKNLLDKLTAKGRKVKVLVSKIEGEINSLKLKKSALDRLLSIFGKISKEEADLSALKNNMLANSINQEIIFKINFKIRQLKAKKFTEQEVLQMEKLGRKYREEFLKYKRR